MKPPFFPHSWEEINPEINYSQMLQEFINNLTLMCSVVFKLQTLSKNYSGSLVIIMQPSQTRLSSTERKAILFLLGCKLRKQSYISPRNVNNTARKSPNSRNQIWGHLRTQSGRWTMTTEAYLYYKLTSEPPAQVS